MSRMITPKIKSYLDEVIKSGKNLVITGAKNSGKSILLSDIKELYGSRIVELDVAFGFNIKETLRNLKKDPNITYISRVPGHRLISVEPFLDDEDIKPYLGVVLCCTTRKDDNTKVIDGVYEFNGQKFVEIM